MQPCSLSILIPVYNEFNNLEIFTKNLLKSFTEIDVEYIFINDGSTDGSSDWLNSFVKNHKDKKIKIIDFISNKGKGKAIQEGLKMSNADYILLQDADLELDTKDSLEIYKIIKNDPNIECIFGSRYLSGKIKKNQNIINELFGKINSIIFNILFNQSLSDVHCGCKIISRFVKDNINLSINDFGLEIDIASQISKQKIEMYEYGISYFPRSIKEGKKITWVDGLKSYYYLFKTRFIDNEFSTQLSIIYSLLYMLYIGSFFGMGLGKDLFMIFTSLVGLFIGLNFKLISSSVIFFFIFFGSLFSQGNGKIYTVLLGFFIGIYIANKISNKINLNSKNNYLKFFI